MTPRGVVVSGSPDVLVVGGGAIGLASAWRLAQRGLAVEVVDPEPGSGASAVAAGLLAPVTEARLGEEALLHLGLASCARWPDFVAELAEACPGLGGQTGEGQGLAEAISYRDDGTVVVALDADDRAVLRDLVDRQRSLGLEVEELSARDLRHREPGLAPAVRWGVLAAAERSVDPAALVAALRYAAEGAGVRTRRERVVGLLPRNLGRDERNPSVPAEISEGAGVELANGDRVAAGTVVVAAGAWSAEVAGLPEPLEMPVRPVKGQVVTLRQRPGDIVVRHTVRGVVRGSSIYVVPRTDGRLVCGATVEEKGWDTTATAGAAYELLRDALTLFPGLDDAELVSSQVGFRPGSPDDLPLIGATGLDGLVLATGHYRNGILLTPITADAVAAVVTGEQIPGEVLACDPRRFTELELVGVRPPLRPRRDRDQGIAGR